MTERNSYFIVVLTAFLMALAAPAWAQTPEWDADAAEEDNGDEEQSDDGVESYETDDDGQLDNDNDDEQTDETTSSQRQSSTEHGRDAGPASATPAPNKMSITLNPLPLIILHVNVTAEYRLRDEIGIGIRGGPYLFPGINGIALAPHFNAYFLGDFDTGLLVGSQVTASTLYINLANVPFVDSNATALMFGVSPGVYLGAKGTADFGLTGMIQAGVSYNISTGAGTDELSNVAALGTGPSLILNLGVGWSF